MVRRDFFSLTALLPSAMVFADQKSVETKLSECRKQIDEADQQIIHFLNQRAKVVAQVGQIKKEAHLPVTAPAREQQVLDHVVQIGKDGPLPPERLRHIYQTVIQEMRDWEATL